MFDEDVIWTCSRYFLYYLRLSSFTAKGIDVKSACIKSVKILYIKGVYASNTCTRYTYAGNTFSTINACIKSVDREKTCTRGAGTVKHSKIHLQFFSILEVELLNMD